MVKCCALQKMILCHDSINLQYTHTTKNKRTGERERERERKEEREEGWNSLTRVSVTYLRTFLLKPCAIYFNFIHTLGTADIWSVLERNTYTLLWVAFESHWLGVNSSKADMTRVSSPSLNLHLVILLISREMVVLIFFIGTMNGSQDVVDQKHCASTAALEWMNYEDLDGPKALHSFPAVPTAQGSG